MPITLDDKLIAQDHAADLLRAARDVADAVARYQDANRGRQKDRAMTGLLIQATALQKLLRKLNLR